VSASALFRLGWGKTTGMTCIKVTSKTSRRKEETIFFKLHRFMATSSDKSLEGAFTYYLGSN
jgi:hypothetical protein